MKINFISKPKFYSTERERMKGKDWNETSFQNLISYSYSLNFQKWSERSFLFS